MLQKSRVWWRLCRWLNKKHTSFFVRPHIGETHRAAISFTCRRCGHVLFGGAFRGRGFRRHPGRHGSFSRNGFHGCERPTAFGGSRVRYGRERHIPPRGPVQICFVGVSAADAFPMHGADRAAVAGGRTGAPWFSPDLGSGSVRHLHARAVLSRSITHLPMG